jgi:large subunit ribosomal protein L30
MPRTFVWHPGKGPKITPANKVKDGEMVRIKQVRSSIGHEARMRATLAAMGLRHHQATIERVMSPGLRGQIKHVRHLLQVTPMNEAPAAKAKKAPAKTEKVKTAKKANG